MASQSCTFLGGVNERSLQVSAEHRDAVLGGARRAADQPEHLAVRVLQSRSVRGRFSLLSLLSPVSCLLFSLRFQDLKTKETGGLRQ